MSQLSDREIAEAEGVTVDHVKRWIDWLGLRATQTATGYLVETRDYEKWRAQSGRTILRAKAHCSQLRLDL